MLGDAIAYQTVRRTLKPPLSTQRCLPPQATAHLVRHMEDLLALCTRPHAPRFPHVGLDEVAKQSLRDGQAPRLVKPGQPRMRVRGRSLPPAGEPLIDRQHVTGTVQRTTIDVAAQVQTPVDDHYPAAERIV